MEDSTTLTDIKLCNQELCTGCFACKQACAKGAIHIKTVDGFLYPEINESLCVDCGLCSKTCPVLNQKGSSDYEKDSTQICYAVWNNNREDRVNSSSGGVFSALANVILKEGGLVYGAAWDKDMRLHHMSIDNVSDLDKLRRSKYVQSNTDGIYKDVRNQVKAGRNVLFCGTPCQIGGLSSFCGNNTYPNLVTVGVVCHGVPSQWSFDKYIHDIEEKEGILIHDCNFRSKKYGWCSGLNLSLSGMNKSGKDVTINEITSDNSYLNSFSKKFFLRESCYSCPFKDSDRSYEADIMLSDFWNLWTSVSVKKVDFSKGVSAVVANTEKGKRLLMQCADSLTMSPRDYSEYASNTGLKRAQKPQNNDIAFEYLQTHSWKETQDKFFPLSFRDKVPVYTRILLGENNAIILKKILKKLK